MLSCCGVRGITHFRTCRHWKILVSRALTGTRHYPVTHSPPVTPHSLYTVYFTHFQHNSTLRRICVLSSDPESYDWLVCYRTRPLRRKYIRSTEVFSDLCPPCAKIVLTLVPNTPRNTIYVTSSCHDPSAFRHHTKASGVWSHVSYRWWYRLDGLQRSCWPSSDTECDVLEDQTDPDNPPPDSECGGRRWGGWYLRRGRKHYKETSVGSRYHSALRVWFIFGGFFGLFVGFVSFLFRERNAALYNRLRVLVSHFMTFLHLC